MGFSSADSARMHGQPVEITAGAHSGKRGVWVSLSGVDQCKVRLRNGVVVQPKRRHVRVAVASALLAANANKPSDGAGHVYVMRDQARPGGTECKVGRGNNALTRAKTFRTANPHLEFMHAVRTDRQKTLEETAHRMLADDGVQQVVPGKAAGHEWFVCSSAQAIAVLTEANTRVKAAQALRRL